MPSGLLLMDPWFEGDVFNESWSLLVPPDLSAIDFARLRHIWISHEHPDHLHFGSLRAIRQRASGPVTVYYRRQSNPNVRQAIERLGFPVVELTPHQEVTLASDLAITLFPTGSDSALAIRAGARTLLNQNDCRLSPVETRAIQRSFPRIDAWCFQFSLAGFYANADDREGLARAKAMHLGLIAKYAEAFRPSIYVPFASFIYFSKTANAYLNEWAVTVDEVLAKLPQLPTQVLWAGETLWWGDWQSRNPISAARWREAYRAPKQIKPQQTVPDQALADAGAAAVKEGLSRGPWCCRPPATCVEIMDTAQVAVIDCRRGRFLLRTRAESDAPVASLPADELLFFLRFPWGADTLNITGCFRLVDRMRWQQLLYFRHSLYRWPSQGMWRYVLPWIGALLPWIAAFMKVGLARRWLAGPPALKESTA